METLDEYLQDLLRQREDAPSVRIRRDGAYSEVTPLHQFSKVRRVAADHNLPLHSGTGYVAISQYNIETGQTWYLIDRE